jgi:two-component sensor histidine kinase
MALIHERLYQSKDLNRIEFSEYVSALTRDLFLSYHVDPAQIILNLKVKDIVLKVDTAILCGLIINELITNALKHAFPDGMHGEIYLQVDKSEERNFTLIVGDTGIGLSEDIDIKNTETLGLQLVLTLTEQIGAKLELDRKGHTQFTIKFESKAD